ncbi:MAG: hypothetical protein IKZ61_05060 [Prevotella sp.]|nr:hypothetical protein [Prevotella sp.]
MRKKILLAAVLSIFFITANAQVDVKTKKKENVQQTSNSRTGSRTLGNGKRGGTNTERITNIKADRTELYSQVVKRYGKWEGYGKPLTMNEASHLRWYYKLTFTGNSKYPSRIQAYDGYHRLTTNHSIGTYLVNQNSDNDQEADSTWVAKLGTVAQWDFVYNTKGDISIERAYDANGDLVYSYYPVMIGKRMAGTYADAWGMPAKLRKAGSAQVVYITFDENGFEKKHEYYDELGFRQKNEDGAYMVSMTTRSDGMVLSRASCNINGQRTIDNFGNCGMQAEYDNKGREIYDTNMDEKWTPKRLRQGADPFYYNMIRRKYDYDEYGRVTKISFVDLNNKPDTNSVGINSQELTYNDRGYITSFSYKDLNGNLCTNPYNGIMKWENEFDEYGRVIRIRNYGNPEILGKSRNKEMYWTYDKIGNEISTLSIDFGGDSICSTVYAKTPSGLRQVGPNDFRPVNYTEIRRFTKDKQLVTIEYDGKGRQTLWGYSDFDGNPISPFGYWKNITEYEDYGDSVVVKTDRYIDTSGKPLKLESVGYAIRKDVSHYKKGVLQTTDTYIYDEDSEFSTGWRTTYDSKGSKTGQASLNKYGNISRLGTSLYHHCAVEWDLKGEKLSSIAGYNEFNEPCYVEDESSVYHFWNYTNEDIVYYDENGEMISDMEAFKNSLPAVMSISVVDSVAYNIGLKDGDIILKYGDWCPELNLQKLEVYNWFYFKLIEFANREKDVMVLRHIPEENRSVILTLRLPKGNIQDLGIFPQLIYYTAKEKQRHENAVREYMLKNNLTALGNSQSNQGNHRVIIRKPNRTTGYVPSAGKSAPHHYNPAVVLSMAKYETRDGAIIADKYWCEGMDTDTLISILESEDSKDYYISMSPDLESTYDGLQFYDNAHDWGVVNIDEAQYARVKDVYDSFIQRYGHTLNPAYRTKNVEASNKKSEIPLIIARTDVDGLARQNGIEGTYVILEYNGWNMSKGLEGIEETLETGKESEKRLVLMQVNIDDEGDYDILGSPQLYNLEKGALGMRVFEFSANPSQYNSVSSAYKKFKKKHKKDYK